MHLGEHLVHPPDQSPLLVVQDSRQTSEISGSEHQVLLNELADQWTESRPWLEVIGGHREDGHGEGISAAEIST